jgi:hypothetical protein
VTGDPSMTLCSFCDLTFSIHNRGIGQLRSYSESQKRKAKTSKLKGLSKFEAVKADGVLQMSLPGKSGAYLMKRKCSVLKFYGVLRLLWQDTHFRVLMTLQNFLDVCFQTVILLSTRLVL